MKNIILSVFAMILVSGAAHATAPKQVCQISKELRLVAFKPKANTAFEVVVEPQMVAQLDYALPVEAELVPLTLAPAASTAKGVTVALSEYKRTIASVMYERRLSAVVTRFYSVRNEKKTLLWTETDAALSYVEGQPRPTGPVVCYEYAN